MIMKEEIITGTCKEHFDKFLKEKRYYLGYEPLSNLFTNALYLEFFDSVNIFISIKYVDVDNDMETKKGFESIITFNRTANVYRAVAERNKANVQALYHANALYNEENI